MSSSNLIRGKYPITSTSEERVRNKDQISVTNVSGVDFGSCKGIFSLFKVSSSVFIEKAIWCLGLANVKKKCKNKRHSTGEISIFQMQSTFTFKVV